jgi:predicted DCC family thiol-disulfide oxidoreductase YuxK
MAVEPRKPILLYDGVCGLCNRLVRFSLKRDHKRRLYFASLQSDFAGAILRRHGQDAGDLDTVYFVENYDGAAERLSTRSDAVIEMLRTIGGIWSFAARLLRLLPKSVRDWGYDVIARNRYRIFGRSETCLLPEANYRDRFLDAQD